MNNTDLDSTITFGKYNGQKILELPKDYLEWLGTLVDLPIKVGVIVHKILQTPYDEIPEQYLSFEESVKRHKKKYPTFDEEEFMNWINKDKRRISFAKLQHLTISDLNKMRHRQESLRHYAYLDHT